MLSKNSLIPPNAKLPSKQCRELVSEVEMIPELVLHPSPGQTARLPRSIATGPLARRRVCGLPCAVCGKELKLVMVTDGQRE